MSKAKFDAAKELIQEKHFVAARAVLSTMPDAQALKWLKEIDRIAPVSSTHRSAARIPWIISGVAILITIVTLVVAFATGASATSTPGQIDTAVIQRLFDAYCAYPTFAKEICNADPPIDLIQDERVQKCFIASGQGQSVELFISCMVTSNLNMTINGTPVFR